MIGTLRKHKDWVWWVVIAATIIGFVIYFNPASRYGGGGGFFSSSGPNLGSINGEPITSDQLLAAMREGRLFMRLRTGSWPDPQDRNQQLQHWAEQSLVMQSLMKDYKITPTLDAATRFTREQLFGVPAGQQLPAEAFQQWVQNDLVRKGGLNLDDLNRFARHQAAQQILISLFGMSGRLITPTEAEFTYRRENQPMVTQVVSFGTTNYYTATTPSEPELQDYFNKHAAEYRTPDRVQINYVAFAASNYLSNADGLLGTNLDEKIDQYYHQLGPDNFKDDAGQILAATNAEARLKLQTRLGAALTFAQKDAYTLLTELAQGHDDTHPYSISDIENVAKAKGLSVKTTEPMDKSEAATKLDLSSRESDILFALRDDSSDDPGKTMIYAPSPLTNGTSVLVVGLQKRIPSELQTLAQVHDQVLKDCRESKALAMAKEAGDEFSAALQVGLTQGKSFDAICSAQNVKPETLPAFALTSTNLPPGFDRVAFQQLEEAAYALPTGQSSKFVPAPDGGFVVYVKERLPVDPARMEKELPIYLARMREQRQTVAFSEWFTRQLQLRFVPPPGQQNSPG